MTDRDQILALADRRATALATRDADALREMMHPQLRWTSSRGVVMDRDTYVATNTAGGSLVWRGQRINAAEVSVVGDTAVLVADVSDDVTIDGVEQTLRLHLTQTFVRVADRWQCLAGHAGPQVHPG
ncbi:nuclear transport factor 2 family protein [Propionibacteriaceae bacterium Y2011]